ncbi:hypothetical protein EVG20_g6195 [Dentipellis fragilis]|uniref:Uncharacterized protein n=13 Tax=Agaricomycetes TaxID=155619 RepID=A0A4Y9YNL0_9AGAM|nr:hypothetical protein EVG20_g6195 [Dentipellis fragilis]
MATNLDDINQTTIYIPYDGPADFESHKESDEDKSDPEPYAPYAERDLPEGPEIRLRAYRAAWSRCLNRVQSIVHQLYDPVADEIVTQIEDAYEGVLPGLPYPEMPVFAISAPSSGSTFVNEIAQRMERPIFEDEDEMEADDTPSAYITHLHPSDCTTVMNAMKALVLGFVEQSPDGQDVKRKPTTSLANYDIQLLGVWYDAIRDSLDDDVETLPPLLVFMHEFEQFDDVVMQDVFYICSAHITRLPLIFILSLSSPPSPSFIHTTYPRSTLALLQIHEFTLPSGEDILEKIVMETFFSLEFEPHIMIGPWVIDFLIDFFSRHTYSVDGVLTILQLAYLKHFDEPLTIFASEQDWPLDILEEPAAFPFLDHLLSSTLDPHSSRSAKGWPISDIPALVEFKNQAESDYQSHLRDLRSAFRVMRCVQDFLLRHGYGRAGMEKDPFEMMCAALRGGLAREGKYLGLMVKKLSVDNLKRLLSDIRTLVEDLPPHTAEYGQPIVDFLDEALQLFDGRDVAEIATEIGGWLVRYFAEEHFVNLEELKLWEIWYTGSTPFPSEMINPSPRATILSGLLYPYEYVESSTEDTGDNSVSKRRALWGLPDITILLRRYLDAGRMINVFDWYESFAVVLENQREHIMNPPKPKSTKTNTKGKKAAKAKAPQEDDHREEEEGDREDEWKMYVQARFVRALHELDFLGFIKHTGRKPDHVMRTVHSVDAAPLMTPANTSPRPPSTQSVECARLGEKTGVPRATGPETKISLSATPLLSLSTTLVAQVSNVKKMGKVHGSLARAGKVKSQTPKVEKQEKKKTPKGRAKKRILYNRRFVNVTTLPGGKRRMNPNPEK